MRSLFGDRLISGQTVGALLSRAYTAGGCLAGAIFGTGTNGAYLEEVGRFLRLFDDLPKKLTLVSQNHEVR